MLVPLADCLNHYNGAPLSINFLEKNLHKSMNKIYLYKHQFEEVSEEDDNVDKVYDKTNNKLSIVCTKLFAEDEIGSLPEEIHNGWTKEDQPEHGSDLYSRELCFDRFRFNQDKLNIAAGYVDEERKFNLDEEPFG